MNHRQIIVGHLQHYLCDMITLHSHCKQAHWQIQGLYFQSLHELFDEVANATLGHADTLAERIQQLGGDAIGCIHHAAQNNCLKAMPKHLKSEKDFLQQIVMDLSHVANHCRSGIDSCSECNEQVTIDILVEITRELDKHLWMLEAHLA